MASSVRPPYRQWRLLALVALGGAVGTGLRETLTLAMPDGSLFPLTTFGINVAGASALGALLEILAPSGAETASRRSLRLLLGTGLLGGFTTYSALTVASAQLLIDAQPLWSLGYALGTVVLGVAAAVGGILLARIALRRGARS